MKKTVFVLLLLTTAWALKAQETKSWEEPTREHFRRMDTLMKTLRNELTADLKMLPAGDSAAYRSALQKAVNDYADDWDYYFYLELQRYKADLGLYGSVPSGKEENDDINGIVEIIRIVRDMKQKSDEAEKEKTEEKESKTVREKKPSQPEPKQKIGAKDKKKKKKHRVTTRTRIDWGMNNMDVPPGQTTYNTWKSQFVALGMETDFRLDKKGMAHYVVGFGFRWHKWVPNGNYLHTVTNRTAFLIPSNVNLSQNKLRTSWVYGNTGFTFHLARKFSLGMEIYGRIRLGSIQKLRYKDGEASYRVREKRDFYERRMNFGGNIFIGGHHWQVFAGMDRLPYFFNHSGRMYQIGITLR